jgi:hypothetical protein
MRTMLELVEERDRCRAEMERRDLESEVWARAFLAGAVAMAEWIRGKNSPGNPPRPSSLTREGETPPIAH